MIWKKTRVFAQEKGHCPTREWETTFEELTPQQKKDILKTGKAEGRCWVNEKGAGGCTTYSCEPFSNK